MKALVIGGTKGFGKFVSDELDRIGYDVVVTGRSGGDYRADVGKSEEWMVVLDKIRKCEGELDVVVFVAGYARASDPSKRSANESIRHEQQNVGYVKTTLDQLLFSPEARIVTLGSQWSYKKGVPELEPYIKAKHQLRELTEAFAKLHPEMSVAHIAAPPMKTAQREKVWSEYDNKPEDSSQIEVGNPKIIAESLIRELMKRTHHGETLQIDPSGEIREVTRIEIEGELSTTSQRKAL